MNYEKPEVTLVGSAASLIHGTSKGQPPESAGSDLGVIRGAELDD